MNSPLIHRRMHGALACVACLLMVGLVAACAQQNGPSQAASGSPSSSAEPAPDAMAGEAAAAEVPQAETPKEEVAAPPAVAAPAPAVETVGSCDGENTVTVAKEATGKALASALMDQWVRDHPEADWVAEEKAKHTMQPPADNSHLLQGDQGKSHAYGNYSQLDLLTWTRETEKAVAEGSRIFHSAAELGSTVSVSCDMCHPHASNTHPETYPKYQVQLGRVVLLRDMINWCMENPVRAEKLEADSPAMRALEAYIMAQRKGVAMEYGKH